MAGRKNVYEISVRRKRESDNLAEDPSDTLLFEHVNHDDIIAIAMLMRRTTGLSADQSDAVAVGLKLLSETMLREKKNALFDPLREGMYAFIANLKALSAARRDDGPEHGGPTKDLR